MCITRCEDVEYPSQSRETNDRRRERVDEELIGMPNTRRLNRPIIIFMMSSHFEGGDTDRWLIRGDSTTILRILRPRDVPCDWIIKSVIELHPAINELVFRPDDAEDKNSSRLRRPLKLIIATVDFPAINYECAASFFEGYRFHRCSRSFSFSGDISESNRTQGIVDVRCEPPLCCREKCAKCKWCVI